MYIFYFQRFSHAIVDGGLQPQFHRDMGSDSNSIPEQCMFLETMMYLHVQIIGTFNLDDVDDDGVLM